MTAKKMLASIKCDTSRLEEKLNRLFEVLPEHIPDLFLDVIASLSSNVILVNDSPAVITGGSLDIVYALDFDVAFYGELMATARALKVDIAH